MAFDMYFAGAREKIDHHEEGLFGLICERDDYPVLQWIWDQFYNGPRIEPERSNHLVHELIRLKSEFELEKSSIFLVDRLIAFFSQAYRLKETVRCVSD